MKQQLNFKTYSGFETKVFETTEPTKEGEGVIYIEGYASKSKLHLHLLSLAQWFRKLLSQTHYMF